MNESDARFALRDRLWTKGHEQYNPNEILSTAQSLLTPPPLDITVKDSESKFVSEINGVVLNTGTVRLFDYGFIPDIKYYSDGKWWVQDVSASIPVKLIENEIKGMKTSPMNFIYNVDGVLYSKNGKVKKYKITRLHAKINKQDLCLI